MVYGEGEGLSVKERKQLGRFLISEAVKNQRTLCEEFYYKFPKGSYRYISSKTVDKRINRSEKSKKDFLTYVEMAHNELLQFSRNSDIIKDVKKYDSFVTVSLAYHRPQSWFKDHVVDYHIAGAHVFMQLNHKQKTNGYAKLRLQLGKQLTALKLKTTV